MFFKCLVRPIDRAIPYHQIEGLQIGLVLFLGSEPIAHSDYYSLPLGGTIVAIEHTIQSINNLLLIEHFPHW